MWALAAPFRAIHREVGGTCKGQGAHLNTVGIALPGPVPAHARRAAQRAVSDESNRGLGMDSTRSAAHA
jgi:hypothetical protein